MGRIWRLVWAALVVGTYFVLAPFGYAAFAVWSLVPTRDPGRRALALQAIMRGAFGLMHAVLDRFWLLDFRPGDLEGELPDSPCVLVANHPTLVDISALIATLPRIVFPVKPALFRAFWARPLLVAAHEFEGASKESPLAIQATIDAATERLRQGYRVVIFPEGTRSPAQGLHPFGRMAFELAVREGVPIVPLVIRCEPRWLTRDCSFFDHVDGVPRLRIRALPPVSPEGSSSRELRDIVKTRIETELSGVQPGSGAGSEPAGPAADPQAGRAGRSGGGSTVAERPAASVAAMQRAESGAASGLTSD